MKKITKLLLTTIILIAFNSSISGQTPNFSGRWILNFEKSKLEDKTDGLTGQMFIIKQEGDKFSLKIYHIYGEKKKKIGFRMLADGKARRVKIIFKGKLEQKENGLQATMWRKNYLNLVNYKFGSNQNELIADEVFTGRPKNHHSIWVFDREVLK
ncbi:MAG: hypothetical protein JNK27_16125 [Chitinophagaceae bacterium]|nr:hypothetical protein [Chitinophagaceae bacterium]